ncbi:hypothetical protein [Porphyromonas levii]|uniref:hypothetical protein n=1 Tax=Porphyromonas levii TaxID=28114 RepID=UPI001B8CEF90|nr:hypothetical protein [Porphyromonas levii]MBR8760569.1 hypothetical protein [Porphyromonas levii]
MKEEFLDECKDRVYRALQDFVGDSYGDRYECLDQLRYNIADDVIYYSEGDEALSLYRDEMADFWEEDAQILHERNINPFTDSGLLDIWRDMLSVACERIAYEVVPEQVGETFAIDADMMVRIGRNLDEHEDYVFSLKEWAGKYPYEPMNFSYEEDARNRYNKTIDAPRESATIRVPKDEVKNKGRKI